MGVLRNFDMVAFAAPISIQARSQQSISSTLRLVKHSTYPVKPAKRRCCYVFAGQRPGSSSKDDDILNKWQDDLRMLLDPKLNSSARQILIQDLTKRFPDSFNEFIQSPCVSRHTNGLADVFRQFTNDILPDLVTNGPRYVSRAVEDAPRSSTSDSTRASSPSSQVPFPKPSFDLDDVTREFRNVFNRTPEGLFTPEFRVLLSAEGYQIRQYPTLIIAETEMAPTPQSTNPTEVESAVAMGQSFNSLAGYLFGKNASSKEMKMTTPVVLSKGSPAQQETMSFIIGEYASVGDVPKSLDSSVSLREEPGKIYAVCEFSGFVTQGEAKRQRERLLSMLARDNIQVTESGKEIYKCMIYNGPSTLPNLRRNELLIEVLYDGDDN